MNLILKRVQLQKDKPRREAIDLFLRQHQLSLEADCEMAIIAEYQRRLVGCGAIAGMRAEVHRRRPVAAGEGLSLKLLTELMTLAYELGRSELFLFTKPCNARSFPAPASGQSPGGRSGRVNGK
jgi:[citrate (pro-3S)-lyase] ligase